HRMSRDGEVSLHADLSAYGAILNDMVVTAEGRAYVDCYRSGPAVPPPAGPDGALRCLSADINRYYVNGLGTSHHFEGEILVVHPDGSTAVAASGLSYPNGLGITADGRTMIASISHDSRLVAFDIGEDGTLANARLWADLPGRHPDGLCLDAEGGVWVACLAISAFLRITEGGYITHHIPTYGRWSIAPALGGADRRTLFMISMEPVDVPDHRSWIEHVRVASPGAGLP
ncbi:MAG TPA: SMP-30/gluconolactonase/LRE family protein, partial [Novosphingobium sp.]|nr:SMP-30/gluconolactonase/LRE family protein [Novosphingobium sp.]